MKTKLIIVAILLSTLLLAACSASAPKLTNVGNEAFAQQAYDDALQAYNEAQVKSPELAEPYYNAANALYRQGNYEEALKQLQKALQLGQSDALAENAHFNAGNVAFNGENWEAAVADYTEALLRNPDDQDAKVNLELALQKLQEQQQDQQNQDQQDQQNQDQQDQQNQDQQNQDQQDQQNQDQQNQNQQDQQDQQNQDQQGQQDQDQQGQQDQQNQDQQGQDQQDQQSEQQDGQGAGQQQSDEQMREGMQLAPGQRMTEDQARQLLAAVARNSDTLQERLGRFLRVSGRPPVQDW